MLLVVMDGKPVVVDWARLCLLTILLAGAHFASAAPSDSSGEAAPPPEAVPPKRPAMPTDGRVIIPRFPTPKALQGMRTLDPETLWALPFLWDRLEPGVLERNGKRLRFEVPAVVAERP